MSGGKRWPVLTVRNPWAWAIAYAGKSPENRGWYMAYRGPLWIHAGARSRWDPAGAGSPGVQAAWRRHFEDRGQAVPELRRNTDRMPFGAVAALVRVTGCHHADECTRPGPAPRAWSRCTPWAIGGQFHIELAEAQPLAEPLECRGNLGLWRLPPEIERAALGQLSGVAA